MPTVFNNELLDMKTSVLTFYTIFSSDINGESIGYGPKALQPILHEQEDHLRTAT